MLPGTSPNATVLDSATRDRTRVLLLFSLSDGSAPGTPPSAPSSTATTTAASPPT
ncbi:hypothetical protein GCM10011428_84600 [Streptomyces violaceus]|uniref:hypothetical protein n=1 Tax=Streptomyces violaceus TaxID=1936 RepID=UPI0031F18F44